ncbi:MAG: PAS domain S-box protein [Gemmatimonadota bacterium]
MSAASMVFAALPQPATFIDARGIIVDVNPAFLEMARAIGREVRREDRVGRPVVDFAVATGSREALAGHVQALLATGEPQARRWQFAAPSGTVHHVQFRAVPVRDAGGELAGGLLLWENITADVWAEQQQACRERLRDAFWQLRRRADVPQVMHLLNLELKALFPQVGNSSVQVYQAETGTWATYGVSTEAFSEVETHGPPGRAVELCWREQRPVYRPDLRTEDPYGEAPALWGKADFVRAVLDVPFFQGTLAVNSPQPGAFAEPEVEALSELAHVLSEGLAQLAEVKSQAVYRALVETPSEMVVMYLAPDGRYLYVSPQVEAATGYRPRAFYADNHLAGRIAHPEDAEQGNQAFRRVAGGGPPERLEVRWRHRDGGYRAGLESLSPIRDAAGRTEAVLVVFQDITERTRAEEEVRTSLSLLNAALESTEDGILIVDREGRMTRWNRRFAEMWRLPEELLAARDDGAAIQGVLSQLADPEQFAAKVQHLYAHPDESSSDELRFRDGRVYERYSQAQRLGEEIVGRVWSFRDITARRRAEAERLRLEQQMQQTQKLESLGVLAGGIAHDFNNILTTVLGNAQLSLMELSPMSPARTSIREIEKAAQHAADLCRQMLAYSGRSSFPRESVDLGELIAEMAHLLRASVSKKAVLKLEAEPGQPPVSADPSQIRQIVMNLVINASDALDERAGGVIGVAVEVIQCDAASLRATELADDLEPGPYLCLEVTDTGSGMDAATRARIFEPFFTTKFTGRGLGLAAVLGIVRAHRGAISVESDPGRGTTFRILLPAMAAADRKATRARPAAAEEWRGRGTVLLVDDEESVRSVVGRMLERLGFATVTAADGAEAVAEFRQRGPEFNLVLLDLTMPGMDGAEAFGELRRLDPEVRVVLTSGYSEEDVAGRFAGQGLAGVLQKPYSVDGLKEVLARLLPGDGA